MTHDLNVLDPIFIFSPCQDNYVKLPRRMHRLRNGIQSFILTQENAYIRRICGKK